MPGEPAGDAVTTQGSVAEAARCTPVQLGYKTFEDGDEAYQYFSYLLNKLTHNQDINEYEHHCLLALLEKGHANAAEKVCICTHIRGTLSIPLFADWQWGARFSGSPLCGRQVGAMLLRVPHRRHGS